MGKKSILLNLDKLSGWPWISDINVYYVFTRMLLTANVEAKMWRNIEVGKGQFIYMLESYARELNLSVQSLRTVLNKLEKSGEITKKSTNKFTIVTICNYDSWVLFVDNEQQTSNKQTTNEKTTEDKDIEDGGGKQKKFVPPAVETVAQYIQEKGYHFDANNFCDFYESKGWYVGKNKMKDWKAACRTWERKQKEAHHDNLPYGMILRGDRREVLKNAKGW